MASQRYGGMETLVKGRMLWLLDKSASLHSLIKGTLGDIHLEGRPIFFVLKRLPVLPSGGITNTRGQNTRSNHLSSGMSEWRGHHCASGHAVLVRHMCCGRWTMRRPTCAGQRTSDSSRLRNIFKTRPAQGKREPAGMWENH